MFICGSTLINALDQRISISKYLVAVCTVKKLNVFLTGLGFLPTD